MSLNSLKHLFLLCLFIGIIFHVYFYYLMVTPFAPRYEYPVLRDQLQLMSSALEHPMLDGSGKYSVVNNLFGANRLGLHVTLIDDVTLVSHCSIRHFPKVITLMRHWQTGPISLAVYVYADDDLIGFFHQLVQFSVCYSEMKERLRISIVKLVDNAAEDGQPQWRVSLRQLHNIIPHLKRTNCREFHAKMEASAAVMANYDSAEPYPNNLLRNVAVQNSDAQFHLVIDMDMYPSPHLHFSIMHHLEKSGLLNLSRSGLLAKSPLAHTAYVIPAFEIADGYAPPDDKGLLRERWLQGIIRPFYGTVCPKCQGCVDYEKWFDMNVTLTMPLTFHDPCEPFLVVARKSPKYDERFKQYGFNRISHVCELHVAGYQFAALGDGFLVHRGWKTKNSFHATKEKEMNENRKLFRVFKEELKDKYPESDRWC